MVLSIMVPHFPAIGFRGMPPVSPTILMSGLDMVLGPGLIGLIILIEYSTWKFSTLPEGSQYEK